MDWFILFRPIWTPVFPILSACLAVLSKYSIHQCFPHGRIRVKLAHFHPIGQILERVWIYKGIVIRDGYFFKHS